MPGSQSVSALRLTAAIKQRLLNYLQRLYLGLPFNALHTDSFTSCMAPVETSTAPDYAFLLIQNITKPFFCQGLLIFSGGLHVTLFSGSTCSPFLPFFQTVPGICASCSPLLSIRYSSSSSLVPENTFRSIYFSSPLYPSRTAVSLYCQNCHFPARSSCGG